MMSTQTPKYNPERFKEVLGLLKLTQQELATELRKTQPTISGILAGKTKDISVDIREHLRNKYNVNTDYLYNLTSEVFMNNSKEVIEMKIRALQERIEKQDQIIELQFREIKRLERKSK